MPRLTRFISFHSPPRALVYYFTIPIQLIASAVSGSGFVLKSPILSIIGTILWVIWAVLMFLVVLPQPETFLNKRIMTLKRSAQTIFIVFFVFGLVELLVITSANTLLTRDNNTKFGQILAAFEVGFNYNDGTAMIHQAVENLLEGDKPYAEANMVQAVKDFHVPLDRVTMLRIGDFAESFPYPSGTQLEQVWQKALQNPDQVPPEMETRLNYPAGSFLIPAPFMWMGITDLRIIYLLIVLAAIGCTTYLIPSKKRFIFIAAVLISLDLWNSVANGETGSLAFAFLLLAWALVGKRLWLSAVFMGIAIITKQTAWFFLPFYLILIYKNTGLKKAGIVTSVIAAIFLVTNLPFIIEDYRMWFTSVFMPMSGNMFPAGVGFIALVTGGVLDIRSPLIFDIIEGLVLVGGVVWYFRYYQRYRLLGPLLAILPLLFAWRSLWPYFFYTGIIIVAFILLDEQDENSMTSENKLNRSNLIIE